MPDEGKPETSYCIGYKLPTFWEYMSIGEDSVRPSGAGLRNVSTFSYYAYLYWTLAPLGH